MYDHYPETWPKMIKLGIAAQHYPPGWTNEKKNIRWLAKLKCGDKIVAAFRGHRFAGYGVLGSGFYRGGPSLETKEYSNEFYERFNCRWTVLPLSKGGPFIRLDSLKKQGFNIDMTIGLCVKEVDGRSFDAIRRELDEAGAAPSTNGASSLRYFASDLGKPPQRMETTVSRIIRDTLKALELKRRYNYACQVCGIRLKVSSNFYYAEVHHLRPLGGRHRGSDIESNMLVLCPNHHALFDLGVPYFLAKGRVIIGATEYKLVQRHRIISSNLEYHNRHISGRKGSGD